MMIVTMLVIVLLLVILSLGGAVLFLGIHTTKTGSIKSVFRFGKFDRILYPGLGLTVPLIEKTEEYSIGTHHDEFPEEPQFIDRVSEIPPEGMVKPIRIGQKGMEAARFYVNPDGRIPDQPDQLITNYKIIPFSDLPDDVKESMKLDSFSAPLTSEVSFVVEWRLNDDNVDTVLNFLENVIPAEGRTREEEVTKRMEDFGEGILQALLTPITLGHAREMKKPLELHLQEQIEILVGERADPNPDLGQKPWGIHIVKASIKDISAGHTVNAARAAAAAAVSNRETSVRDAEAAAERTELTANSDKYSRKKNAEAEAYEEKKKGEGERDRIMAMCEAMKDPNARFLAQLDVAEQVLGKGKTIWAPSDVGVAATILSLGGELGREAPPESKP